MNAEANTDGSADVNATASAKTIAKTSAKVRSLVAWSAIAEPGDAEAHALVEMLGPVEALAWLDGATADPVTATAQLAPHAAPPQAARMIAATERWKLRGTARNSDQHLERAAAVGARVIGRGEPGWPDELDSLGLAAPYCLWVRGPLDVAAAWARSIAIVGSRSSTDYGEHVAGTMAADLADDGWAIISGGAYGIDIRAHRGALAVDGPTVAVMAGGVDRMYPVGNAEALDRILEVGAVVSEVPPGYAPHRSRFLTRNRLIAAARATVVIEAAHRSGALSTAAHAVQMARPVAALPGPVTSASSAGCHRLIRDGSAVLVTAARDVAELAGPLDAERVAPGDGGAGAPRLQSELDAPEFSQPSHRQAYDAIGGRGSTVAQVAALAGLSMGEARAALGALELGGLAGREGVLWRSIPPR